MKCARTPGCVYESGDAVLMELHACRTTSGRPGYVSGMQAPKALSKVSPRKHPDMLTCECGYLSRFPAAFAVHKHRIRRATQPHYGLYISDDAWTSLPHPLPRYINALSRGNVTLYLTPPPPEIVYHLPRRRQRLVRLTEDTLAYLAAQAMIHHLPQSSVARSHDSLLARASMTLEYLGRGWLTEEDK